MLVLGKILLIFIAVVCSATSGSITAAFKGRTPRRGESIACVCYLFAALIFGFTGAFL